MRIARWICAGNARVEHRLSRRGLHLLLLKIGFARARLGYTGHRLNAGDLVCGLATHFMEPENLAKFKSNFWSKAILQSKRNLQQPRHVLSSSVEASLMTRSLP